MLSCCFSDDSDDSDAELETGLSLDASSQHIGLSVKSEPCEQEEGLPDSKPLNGVLQAKGKSTFMTVEQTSWVFLMTKWITFFYVDL